LKRAPTMQKRIPCAVRLPSIRFIILAYFFMLKIESRPETGD
jgi:hypothetical protein